MAVFSYHMVVNVAIFAQLDFWEVHHSFPLLKFTSYTSNIASSQHLFLSSLLQEMAWRQIGAMPFIEPMIIGQEH